MTRAPPISDRADENGALREALGALVSAVDRLEIRSLVAGWNGEGRDAPYSRHHDRLGVTLLTNCGQVYAIDEEVEKARAALSSPVTSPWQGIETAPKGQKIIAGYYNGLGRWRSIMACYYLSGTLEAGESYDGGDEDGYAPEGWYEESETHDEIRPCQIPTHWTRVPGPPK